MDKVKIRKGASSHPRKKEFPSYYKMVLNGVMTAAQVQRELGISNRCYYNWINELDNPKVSPYSDYITTLELQYNRLVEENKELKEQIRILENSKSAALLKQKQEIEDEKRMKCNKGRDILRLVNANDDIKKRIQNNLKDKEFGEIAQAIVPLHSQLCREISDIQTNTLDKYVTEKTEVLFDKIFNLLNQLPVPLEDL